MSPTKVLTINPDFFSSKSSNSKTMKKERKHKPSETKTTNSMRKALLAKIRDYQKKEGEKLSEKNKQQIVEKDPLFESEFNKSLNFLQQISNKQKDKNKSFKRHPIRNPNEQVVNIDLPEALIEIPQLNNERKPSTPIFNNQINPQNIFESNLSQIIQPNTQMTTIHTPPLVSQPITIDEAVSFKPLIKNTDNQIIQQTEPVQSIQPINQPIQQVQPYTPEIVINTEPEPTQNIKLEINNVNSIPDLREKVKSNIKKFLNKSKHKLASTSITQNTPILTNNHNLTIKSPPPYSNLKGGNKPTFREWNKTYKTYSPQPTLRIDENKNIKRTIPSKKIITRKIKTIKYNLGKKGKNINVLIKNNNTRKKIKQEIISLRKKPILEVKEYLHDKNLIKSGTLAPNDVLREIYEQSILSGDLINENKQNLIHNFLNTKPEHF